MTPEQKLESIRRLIAAREDVYDDWVGIDDLRSIIDNGVEPEHVAEQLKPWYFTDEQRQRLAEMRDKRVDVNVPLDDDAEMTRKERVSVGQLIDEYRRGRNGDD